MTSSTAWSRVTPSRGLTANAMSFDRAPTWRMSALMGTTALGRSPPERKLALSLYTPITSNGMPFIVIVLPIGSSSSKSRSFISVEITATRAPVRASAVVNARPGKISGPLIAVHSAEYPSSGAAERLRSRNLTEALQSSRVPTVSSVEMRCNASISDCRMGGLRSQRHVSSEPSQFSKLIG